MQTKSEMTQSASVAHSDITATRTCDIPLKSNAAIHYLLSIIPSGFSRQLSTVGSFFLHKHRGFGRDVPG